MNLTLGQAIDLMRSESVFADYGPYGEVVELSLNSAGLWVTDKQHGECLWNMDTILSMSNFRTGPDSLYPETKEEFNPFESVKSVILNDTVERSYGIGYRFMVTTTDKDWKEKIFK